MSGVKSASAFINTIISRYLGVSYGFSVPRNRIVEKMLIIDLDLIPVSSAFEKLRLEIELPLDP